MCVLRLHLKPSGQGGVRRDKTISTATSCARLCVKNTGQKPAAPPCSRGKETSICAVLSSQRLRHSLSVPSQPDSRRLPAPAARLLRHRTSMSDDRKRPTPQSSPRQNFSFDFLFRLNACAASVACNHGFQLEQHACVLAHQSRLPALLESLALPGRSQPSRV